MWEPKWRYWVRHFGFCSLNACRIVYLIDNDAGTKRFGFAYGTLEEHAERGEERFAVERHQASAKLYYDILAFPDLEDVGATRMPAIAVPSETIR